MTTQSITSTTSTGRALFACAFALALTPACIDASDDEAPTRTEGPVPDDTVFVETFVELGPDGSMVVHEPHAVTAGEQREQNEIRRAVERGERAPSAIVIDSVIFGCPTHATWLYSRTDWTGDRICFAGRGTLDPAQYPRYVYVNGLYVGTSTWALQNGSYWPGQYDGAMGNRLDYLDPPSTQIWTNSFLQYGARQVFVRPSPMEYLTHL